MKRVRRRFGGEDLLAAVGVLLISGAVWRLWSAEVAALVSGIMLFALGLLGAVIKARHVRRG